MNKIWYAIGDSFDYLFAMAIPLSNGMIKLVIKTPLGSTVILHVLSRLTQKILMMDYYGLIMNT